MLSDFGLEVAAGEIHGLVGQNGSGKSTVIKILSGYHRPDPGAHIEICGHRLEAPRGPRRLPVSFVHQDLALNPTATVLENICIADFATRWLIVVDWRRNAERASRILERFDIRIPLDARIATLEPTDRAFVAIARAVEELPPGEEGVLVLDEPTAYLPQDSVQRLFEVVKAIAATGVAVLFVSHDLGEVLELTHRVTVLRDGLIRFSGLTDDLDETILIRHIVGAGFTRHARPRGPISATAEVVLSAEGIDTGDSVLPRLTLKAGEVVGLTGLLGSGFSRPLYALFGVSPTLRAGVLEVGGERIDCREQTPASMLGRGVALIPADRLGSGSIQNLTAMENLNILTLDRYTRKGGWISRRSQLEETERVMREYGVQPFIPAETFERFSGGNQQKMVLAKWLQTHPRVLLLHEPTHGVDVGARQEIYRRVEEMASRGIGIIVATSDYEELAAICDRVIVFRKGEPIAELQGEFDHDSIMRYCFGG